MSALKVDTVASERMDKSFGFTPATPHCLTLTTAHKDILNAPGILPPKVSCPDYREIWIQASYNPILGADGKPFKVVKYASDITASKLEHADRVNLLAINATIEAAGAGQPVTENCRRRSWSGKSSSRNQQKN